MRLGEESIVIRRPVGDVFRFVSDPTNDPTWHTTVVEARQASPGPVGVGTTFEGIYDSRRRTLDDAPHPDNFQHISGVIVQYVPERFVRLRLRFTDPPRGLGARVLGDTFDLTFRLERHEDGTRLYRGGDFRPVPLIWPLLPVFAWFNAKRNLYLLGNLKRALEGPST